MNYISSQIIKVILVSFILASCKQAPIEIDQAESASETKVNMPVFESEPSKVVVTAVDKPFYIHGDDDLKKECVDNQMFYYAPKKRWLRCSYGIYAEIDDMTINGKDGANGKDGINGLNGVDFHLKPVASLLDKNIRPYDKAISFSIEVFEIANKTYMIQLDMFTELNNNEYRPVLANKVMVRTTQNNRAWIRFNYLQDGQVRLASFGYDFDTNKFLLSIDGKNTHWNSQVNTLQWGMFENIE